MQAREGQRETAALKGRGLCGNRAGNKLQTTAVCSLFLKESGAVKFARGARGGQQEPKRTLCTNRQRLPGDRSPVQLTPFIPHFIPSHDAVYSVQNETKTRSKYGLG